MVIFEALISVSISVDDVTMVFFNILKNACF